jgi:hypothetical protein
MLATASAALARRTIQTDTFEVTRDLSPRPSEARTNLWCRTYELWSYPLSVSLKVAPIDAFAWGSRLGQESWILSAVSWVA